MSIDRILSFSCVVAAFLLCHGRAVAQQQQDQQPKDVSEIAAERAEKLGSLLGLEEWQVYCVDSTLYHNLKAMEDKYKELTEAKVMGQDIYLKVQDEWGERTDEAFRKIFTDGQWDKYLRSGGQREIKARERREKERRRADEALQKLMEKGKL